MPYAKLPQVTLHYLQFPILKAENAALVLIHGLASNLAFWYLQIAPAFAQTHPVILFDLRGHGRSSRPTKGYHPKVMAEDLHDFLDHLGIQRVHLLGHSFGGVVALHFSHRYPERVKSLILADVHLSMIKRRQRLNRWHYWPKLKQVLQALKLPITIQGEQINFQLLEACMRMQLTCAPDFKRLQPLLSPFLGVTSPKEARLWLQLIDNRTIKQELYAPDELTLARLRSMFLPTLLIYGEHSQALQAGQFLNHLWPHAQFKSVPNAGHFFPLSQHTALLNATYEFWNSTDN
jgi:pimeloyl-ACP methyl ester carboxylesterase